ncbi:MAG: DUF5677 domain-containing protein [Ignavibacteriales bacterium]|nr:DUF5677 domain-containing protein [Ignavibacteriales bacterium]
MTFEPFKELADELEVLSTLCQEAERALPTIDQKRNPNDTQHQVLFLSLVRVIKYFDAYLQLARTGYGEPAASLVRSIHEASLWMRWSLISKNNAEVYFNASKGEAIRIANKLLARNLIRLTNFPDQTLAQEMLKSHLKNFKFPSWDQLAKETGLEDLHSIVYPFLSAMSHGSWLFMGEGILKDKTVSPLPDFQNILPYLSIANNTFRDCYLVCKEWILHGRLHPVPDIRKLMTRQN